MNKHYIIGIDEAGRGAWAWPVVAGWFMIEQTWLSWLSSTIPEIKDSKKLSKKERENIFSTIEYLSHKSECQFTFAYRDAEVIDAVGIREANRFCMEDIILSFLQYIETWDTVEIWIDGCDNYTFAVEDFEYLFAQKKKKRTQIRWYIKNGETEGDKLFESDHKQWKWWALANVPQEYFQCDDVAKGQFLSPSEPFVSFQLWKERNTFGNKSTEELLLLWKERTISYLINGDDILPIISLGGIIAKVVRDRMMCEYSEDFPLYWFDEHVGYGTRKHSDALHNYNITPIHRKSYAPVKRLISGVSSI
jgi:ribonuclease HII